MKTFVALVAAATLGSGGTANLAAQPASGGWPEIISILTTQRSQAETCVGLLKSRADAATLDRTKTTYGMAKADVEGVIGGLEVVLGEGRKPDKLPNLVPSLTASGARLKQICEAASATAAPNTKGLWDEIAKGVAEAAVEPIVNKISDGVGAIWAHYVIEPDRLALETRRSKLEAARWPEFAEIAVK